MTQLDIRNRAARFAERWSDARYEKGETQTFYNDFLSIFGIERRSVAVYERYVSKFGDHRGYIDLFWPRKLLVEQKSRGRDLEAAKRQAAEYFTHLESEETPRYIMACDFQSFHLIDLDKNEEKRFTLKELPEVANDCFAFMTDRPPGPDMAEEHPVSIEASRMMGRIYDSLARSGYDKHDMGHLLTRMTFCLFADDTGIFEKGKFAEYVEHKTAKDGTDLGDRLMHLFQVLDTPEDERQASLDPNLARFPYINGRLFERTIRIPAFDSDSRGLLTEAGRHDWSKVSPAIFGSLFQTVMSKKKRRDSGAHYTSEENIMKLIRPLFLDGLRSEFEKVRRMTGPEKRRIGALRGLQERLSGLRFLDPACGAGNFLIIAYREMRRLELDIIMEIHDTQTKRIDVRGLSTVNVSQFYGIEINEFSARIAETALWMMDHLMNNELGQRYGLTYTRIPIRESPTIVVGDALETDWGDLLPPAECSYVLGNPPYGGSKTVTREKSDQMRKLAEPGGGGGTLDYVCGWFIKASRYVQDGTARIGFVATNSITQGEQVAQLWPVLFDRYGMHISFAYQTFIWESDAKGKAHVHVVIIGLDRNDCQTARRLFHYDGVDTVEENPENISPYLFGVERQSCVVGRASKQMGGLPNMRMGSKPIDDGHYIFTDAEKNAFLDSEPGAEPYMVRYVGAREFINGNHRWILKLHDVTSGELKCLPETRMRVNKVKTFRLGSTAKSTRKLAETPTLYHLNVIPESEFLVVPSASSERRRYVPIGYLSPPDIPSNLTMIVEDASLGLFGLVTSRMHMVWLRHAGGRLKSDLRYSAGMVYNTFPVPKTDLSKLDARAQKILDVREGHSGRSLADLYDPLTMPADLVKAHRALDSAVDRMYRRSPFMSDDERFGLLLDMYCDGTSGRR